MTQTTKVPFAGEEFLTYIPPSHFRASRVIVASSVILFAIIFYVIPRYIQNCTNVKEKKEIKDTFNEKKKEPEDAFDRSDSPENKETDMRELLELFFIFPKTLYTILIFSLILFSPQNHETARRIYQSPMLHPQECRDIIEMAASVATRKYREAIATKKEMENRGVKDVNEIQHIDKLIQWPEGWSKDRHGSYPTTDLNIAIDFDQKSKRYIQNILDASAASVLRHCATRR